MSARPVLTIVPPATSVEAFDHARRVMLRAFKRLVDEGLASEDLAEEAASTGAVMRAILSLSRQQDG